MMKTENIAWWMVIIGAICFVAYFVDIACSGFGLFGVLDVKDIELTAQISSFFGGVVGSIWALAGVFLYSSALKLQNKQFVAQQEEMEQSKSLLSKQQFENTFFGLLKTQQELKENLQGTFFSVFSKGNSYTIISSNYKTSLFFSRILGEMTLLYKVYQRETYESWKESSIDLKLRNYYEGLEWNALNQDPYNLIEEESDSTFKYQEELNKMFQKFNLDYLTSRYNIHEKTVSKAQSKPSKELMCKYVYGHVYIAYQDQLGHYFMHLYNIVKLLDEERIACVKAVRGNSREIEIKAEIERRFSDYFSFVHSMLSFSELALLFYNSLLFPKAKDLYVKYSMFNNLPIGKLLEEEHADFIEGAKLKKDNELFSEIIKDL